MLENKSPIGNEFSPGQREKTFNRIVDILDPHAPLLGHAELDYKTVQAVLDTEQTAFFFFKTSQQHMLLLIQPVYRVNQSFEKIFSRQVIGRGVLTAQVQQTFLELKTHPCAGQYPARDIGNHDNH